MHRWCFFCYRSFPSNFSNKIASLNSFPNNPFYKIFRAVPLRASRFFSAENKQIRKEDVELDTETLSTLKEELLEKQTSNENSDKRKFFSLGRLKRLYSQAKLLKFDFMNIALATATLTLSWRLLSEKNEREVENDVWKVEQSKNQMEFQKVLQRISLENSHLYSEVMKLFAQASDLVSSKPEKQKEQLSVLRNSLIALLEEHRLRTEKQDIIVVKNEKSASETLGGDKLIQSKASSNS
jgi:ElaB/YqjD/DUF883 family membrane-anchored ribosome-binding protein